MKSKNKKALKFAIDLPKEIKKECDQCGKFKNYIKIKNIYTSIRPTNIIIYNICFGCNFKNKINFYKRKLKRYMPKQLKNILIKS